METLALTETKKNSILQDLETTRRSYATRRLKMTIYHLLLSVTEFVIVYHY